MSDSLQRRFISMFDTAVEGLWIMTPDNKVSFYNHNFYSQFDIDLDNAVLNDWTRLIHPEDQVSFSQNVTEHFEQDISEQRVISRYRALKKDGSYCWIEAAGVTRKDENGEYMVGNHRDITSEIKLEHSIKRLAFFDKISGLPNKDKLKQDLERRTSSVSLIKIHLDGIKSYINLYGEQNVQDVINLIIEALQIFSVYSSRFYRSSVDTFSVLFDAPIADSLLAELCSNFISLFRESSQRVGVLYVGGVYLGAYSCHDPEQPSDSVIAWTSQTCEYAHKNEPSHWAVCNSEVQKKVERYFFIEKELKTAIDNDEIAIRLQPIISVESSRVMSFEALARWPESKIGEIYPDEFIPAAERKGLIKALGEKVLAQASSFISYYNEIWKSDIRVNVNVSVLQLLDGTFPVRALRIVNEQGISPEQIVLELTESVLLDDQVTAMQQLMQLEELGFTLAMDDFGTGHASVTGFFKLPFQVLKIDRELANESLKEAEPYAYLEFLTMLCAMKNIAVTIEGIETQEMVDKLTPLDISSFQGYLFAKPYAIEEALKLHPQQTLPIIKKR